MQRTFAKILHWASKFNLECVSTLQKAYLRSFDKPLSSFTPKLLQDNEITLNETVDCILFIIRNCVCINVELYSQIFWLCMLFIHCDQESGQLLAQTLNNMGFVFESDINKGFHKLKKLESRLLQSQQSHNSVEQMHKRKKQKEKTKEIAKAKDDDDNSNDDSSLDDDDSLEDEDWFTHCASILESHINQLHAALPKKECQIIAMAYNHMIKHCGLQKQFVRTATWSTIESLLSELDGTSDMLTVTKYLDQFCHGSSRRILRTFSATDIDKTDSDQYDDVQSFVVTLHQPTSQHQTKTLNKKRHSFFNESVHDMGPQLLFNEIVIQVVTKLCVDDIHLKKLDEMWSNYADRQSLSTVYQRTFSPSTSKTEKDEKDFDDNEEDFDDKDSYDGDSD